MSASPERLGATVMRRAAALALALALTVAVAAGHTERFDVAWRLVAERYWDFGGLSVDWNEVRDRYEPLALAAADDAALYAVLEAMYAELGDDHSVFVPPERVAELRALYGDLPCLAVFGQRPDATAPGAGALTGPLRHDGPVGFALLADGVGYLHVADLVRAGTVEGVRGALATMTREGASAFVLDLRGNPGGRLVTMMQVAGAFTRGFLWRTITTWSFPLPYPALGTPVTEAPLAILVDGDVHSAAEGLAGGLQARGRALVVGATTAGNVEAVMPFCLRDGSQAWVATGVLAPIGAPTWAGRGVVPDVAAAPDEALPAALRALRDRP
jgi:carboxyl-terminal processing protease